MTDDLIICENCQTDEFLLYDVVHTEDYIRDIIDCEKCGNRIWQEDVGD